MRQEAWSFHSLCAVVWCKWHRKVAQIVKQEERNEGIKAIKGLCKSMGNAFSFLFGRLRKC
ncbi:hypothetical protein HMPREF2992_12015 [Prevotella sp. HMSC069G02]|nr:hypothetical protein HMPREF2992_12015 [Prevotella sp. HMSC069G02]